MSVELRTMCERRIGTSLREKYLLERVLGVGGMAGVFAAKHRNGGKFAVKVLHPELFRVEDVRNRFLREGYIANKINHPSVVRILDDDVDRDTAFIVMELLEGRTLQQEWHRQFRRLAPWRAATIASSVLEVLEVAHAAGVIHRDIKAENVFLTSDGGMKILDFGIARIVDDFSTTRTGQTMGTPGFAAPEQAAGRVREVDHRADLFSVGAMLFTLVSGEPLHKVRTPAEAMIYAATVPARSMLDVMPDVDPGLANVIDVAVSFDKEQRWANAKVMRTALGSVLRTLPQERDPMTEGAAAPPPGEDNHTVPMVASSSNPFLLMKRPPEKP